jgi:flagellar basal body-associated protein FliL
MMIIIIVLLVALIGTVAFVSFYMMSFLKNAQNPSTGTPSEQVVQHLTPDQLSTVKLSEPIVTNLAAGLDGKTSHMASVSISVLVDMTDKKNSEAFLNTLNANQDIISDICLGIIRSMTKDEIDRADSQAILKKDVLDALRETFESNLIYEVLVSNIKST